MSRVAEITALVRIAGAGLSPDVLARAIHRRWPDASLDEMNEVVGRAANAEPNDAEEQAAMTLAAAAILGRRA